MKYKPDIIMASELIRQLESAILQYGDLPVDIAVDYDGYDDTFTARGPLDCEVECRGAEDWARDILPDRLLLSSSGFLTNLACIPD